ncbi:MAG: PAS domain S-box protein [Desulfobacteraceae bacterium]|nr:MAG: PAS domain S-box protein [Desulfobacteraceae bacterium]
MKLRTILLVLSLLAFFSASTAGYLYFSSSRESVLREANRNAAISAETISDRLSSHLHEYLKSVRAISCLPAIRDVFPILSNDALPAANATLDHFQRALEVDVCYLMDGRGVTIASSNRNDPDSFVGADYSFRPYFQKAIGGQPTIYMATGVTSKKRGVYYSHPVYPGVGETPGGVLVIKAPVDLIEKEFLQAREGIVALVEPHGLIFVTNREKWLYRLIWKPDPDEVAEISLSRQFGDGPFLWTGLDRRQRQENRAFDSSGKEYAVYTKEIDKYPGWSIVYLQDTQEVSRKIPFRFIRMTGLVILAFCGLTGVLVFFLFRKASSLITQRRAAEAALRQSEETALALLNAPTESALLLNREGRILALNRPAADRFGKKKDELIGRCAFDLFEPLVAEVRRAYHDQVLQTCRPVRYEDKREGRWLNTNIYPVFDPAGDVVRVAVFSRDVTDQKAAEEALQAAKEELLAYSKDLERRVQERTGELRRLSASIMSRQEKERAAIARELHDELGQMLTALRFEAVWLWERLKDNDSNGAERAFAMCGLIDKSIDEVRGISIRLRPGVLDDLGLIAALEWYATDFEKRTGIECSFSHSNVDEVNDTLATAAYRIAQEALTNVARHAQASHARVTLVRWNGTLTLSVADNGRGFDAGSQSDPAKFGLVGMRERSSLAGGSLEIHSTEGEGTEVVFRVFIAHEEAFH